MFRILAAENNRKQRRDLKTVLQNAGYEVLDVSDSVQTLEMLERRHADLILLAADLPDTDGYALLVQLRTGGWQLPVLLLCEGNSVQERCRGLRLGADDCMGKPADPEELLLRIGSLLRRVHAETDRNLKVGQSVLSYDSFTVTRNGIQTEFPRKEFLMLYKMLSNPGRAFTRRQLMDEIWDRDTQSDEHTVVVHINRLRDRIRDNPDFSVHTVRGLGYKAVIK